MTSLSLTLWDRPNGVKLADVSGRIDAGLVRQGEHGPLELAFHVPMRHDEVVTWLGIPGTPYVVLSDDTRPIWTGRVEDRTEDDTGIELRAFGYWNALRDVPINHLWSDIGFERWRLLNGEAGALTPDTSSFYALSKNDADGMVLTPKNGEPFTTAKPARIGYEPPDRYTLNPRYITYTWSFQAPAAWRFTVYRASTVWATASIIHGPIVGTGAATAPTTFSATFAAATRLAVVLEPTSTVTYNADTAPVILKLNAIEVRGNVDPPRIDRVARLIVSDINSVNPSHLSASTTRIQDGTLDLRGEIYEDADAADVLTRLAALGDAAGNRWEVGVDVDQRLYARPRSSLARTWYVATAELRYRSTLETLANSYYATYRSATGRTLRTGTTENNASVARYGLIRRRALAVTTDNATQATTHRNTALADTANPPLQVDMMIDAIYGADGARYPLWSVQPGDRIVARTEGVARRVAGTEYDLIAGTLGVEWESPTPSLETLGLRESEGF